MCGILLIHSKKGSRLNHNKIMGLTETLVNRGPDKFKFNYFNNKTLFIANSVLSVCGKINSSNDLYSSINNKYSIAYNGEIYNYKKLSIDKLDYYEIENDTKLIVNLYQKINNKNEIPKLFEGMFAYVIFDFKKNQLKIVNDSQGEKNLYYYNDSNFLIISSTINPIIKFLEKKVLNKKVIYNYFFTRHFMPIHETAFKNIRLFPNSLNATYHLNKKLLKINTYDNPLDWISEKTYKKNLQEKETNVIRRVSDKLRFNAQKMLPEIDFGSVVSGGIDSTLQAKLVDEIKRIKSSVVLNFDNNDKITKNIDKFNDYFTKKIKKIFVSPEIYKKYIQKCYDITCSPLQTHDLPGRFIISEYFKKEKLKVFFSADGCDELFFGQQIYLNCFKNLSYKKNNSPYSSYGYNYLDIIQNNKTKHQLDTLWKNVFERYEFIKDLKIRSIQSSLFLDYFLQSINVANRSNDLISCNNSVEPRNIYIQKNILKEAINLPLKLKFNESVKNIKLQQKYILKKIFSKKINTNLIFNKEGFSGFPNALGNKNSKYQRLNDLFKLDFSKKILDSSKIDRNIEWKIINSENFLKFFF
tara:strand:+ start:887 stop:2635 length:1749 start_codon:yes stop_codon:yes gene_type:complete